MKDETRAIVERYALRTDIDQTEINSEILSDCFFAVLAQCIVVEVVRLDDAERTYYETCLYVSDDLMLDNMSHSYDDYERVHRALYVDLSDAMMFVHTLIDRIVRKCYA